MFGVEGTGDVCFKGCAFVSRGMLLEISSTFFFKELTGCCLVLCFGIGPCILSMLVLNFRAEVIPLPQLPKKAGLRVQDLILPQAQNSIPYVVAVISTQVACFFSVSYSFTSVSVL